MAKETFETDPQQLVEEQINLPSPPAIAVQILNTVQKEDCSLEDLERIISADPALTSKLLRIANSAFYSLPHEVTSISRALSVLGTNIIKNIALSFVIAGDQQGDDTSLFDFNYFWRRSVTSAVAGEAVTSALGIKDDDIFVTALLQDIGILVLYHNKGDEYLKMVNESMMSGRANLILSEQEKFQFDHQLLGFLLLDSWGIPLSISNPIRYHHIPELATEKNRSKTRIVEVANLLSEIYSGTETSHNFRNLQKKMTDYFDFSHEKTREILDDVAVKSVDILKLFDIDPGEMKPYSQILQEANDELGRLNLSYEQLVLELKESKDQAERFANDLRRANEKLEELAFRDGLTGLYNHRYFQEVLSKELTRAKRYNRPLSLVLFDIDFFKKVNDNHGHPAGDKVLLQLAKAVQKAVRPSDIVARYGGEEFAVILTETNHVGLKIFSERLRRCAESLVTVLDHTSIKITISCGGVQILPTDETSQAQLIEIADKGLFLSKRNGRNRVTIMPMTTSS